MRALLIHKKNIVQQIFIDFLLVAGWGAGWSVPTSSNTYTWWRWGGWAWWVIQCCWYNLTEDMCVIIWQWGTYVCCQTGNNWWNSCFWRA